MFEGGLIADYENALAGRENRDGSADEGEIDPVGEADIGQVEDVAGDVEELQVFELVVVGKAGVNFVRCGFGRLIHDLGDDEISWAGKVGTNDEGGRSGGTPLGTIVGPGGDSSGFVQRDDAPVERARGRGPSQSAGVTAIGSVVNTTLGRGHVELKAIRDEASVLAEGRRAEELVVDPFRAGFEPSFEVRNLAVPAGSLGGKVGSRDGIDIESGPFVKVADLSFGKFGGHAVDDSVEVGLREFVTSQSIPPVDDFLEDIGPGSPELGVGHIASIII